MLVNKSSTRLPDVNHDATANAALDDVAGRLDHLGKPDLPRHGRKLSPIEVARQPLSRHCRSAIGRTTEPMPRSEAPRRINGATEVGKSMPPASPQSRRTASSKAHWRAWSSWPRRAARPALFSQRFCGLFAFDDVGRRQDLSNDWPALAGRSRP